MGPKQQLKKYINPKMPRIFCDPYIQKPFCLHGTWREDLMILEFLQVKLGNKDSCTFVQCLISFDFITMTSFPYFSSLSLSVTFSLPFPPLPPTLLIRKLGPSIFYFHKIHDPIPNKTSSLHYLALLIRN